MSRIDTLVCTDARKTKYRFVVLTMIFLVYAINYADRTNIGAVLPFIIDEFHINNFEAGAIASMFFLGYAVSQIPAGFFIAKRGTRGLVSLSIFGFSAFTWLMGTVSSVFGLKLVRLGLGLSEGPCPVGLASTINNWFPPKEKATATGVLHRGDHVCADYCAAAGGVDCGDLGVAVGLFLFCYTRNCGGHRVVSAGQIQAC
ncbi:D-glucarate permease [Klebsiella pneumoniae IS39]|nr:D-glucarate permease [Klebsiella pneumoniae IS39]